MVFTSFPLEQGQWRYNELHKNAINIDIGFWPWGWLLIGLLYLYTMLSKFLPANLRF